MTGPDSKTEASSNGTGTLLAPETVLLRGADDLADRFTGLFTKETVERCVFDCYAELRRTARLPHHLPTLSLRFARERLEAQAQVSGALPRPVPEVLFVCTQNAGRSQLAAVLLSHHAQGSVHVRSAGTNPGHQVNPAVVEALREVGVQLEDAYPKPLTDEVVMAADVVITMGCGDACPVYPGKRYYDWAIDDPEGKSLARVRSIRDDVDSRVRGLLGELSVTPASDRA